VEVGGGVATSRARVFFIAELARVYDKLDPAPIYRGLDEMLVKLGHEGIPHVAAMAKRLGSWRPGVRRGQRFVLEFLLTQLSKAGNVEVEKYVPMMLKGGTKQVRRFYDLVLRIGDDLIHIECKAWDVTKWGTFPPSKATSPILRREWLSAREQFVRDIAHHGAQSVEALRWVLPKAFLEKHGQRMADEFASLLSSRRFVPPTLKPVVPLKSLPFVTGDCTICDLLLKASACSATQLTVWCPICHRFRLRGSKPDRPLPTDRVQLPARLRKVENRPVSVCDESRPGTRLPCEAGVTSRPDQRSGLTSSRQLPRRG
jgi:hypothetical protein